MKLLFLNNLIILQLLKSIKLIKMTNIYVLFLSKSINYDTVIVKEDNFMKEWQKMGVSVKIKLE